MKGAQAVLKGSCCDGGGTLTNIIAGPHQARAAVISVAAVFLRRMKRTGRSDGGRLPEEREQHTPMVSVLYPPREPLTAAGCGSA